MRGVFECYLSHGVRVNIGLGSLSKILRRVQDLFRLLLPCFKTIQEKILFIKIKVVIEYQYREERPNG